MHARCDATCLPDAASNMTFIVQASIHSMQNTASIELNMHTSNAPVIAIKNTNRILDPASTPFTRKGFLGMCCADAGVWSFNR